MAIPGELAGAKADRLEAEVAALAERVRVLERLDRKTCFAINVLALGLVVSLVGAIVALCR